MNIMPEKKEKGKPECKDTSNVVIMPQHPVCDMDPDAKMPECRLDKNISIDFAINRDTDNAEKARDEHLKLGEELINQGKLTEAIRELKLSIRERPHEPEAYLHLGDIYERQGELEEAVKQYDVVLHIKPDDELTKFKRDTAVRQRDMIIKQ
jgi:tetratricopeptide (TPR) repeat protein